MPDLTGIPPLFHSEYEGAPFDTCAVCGRSLLEPDVVYSISKTCNQGEAIVEMAVCDQCSEELRQELSESSKQAVAEFVESRLLESALENGPEALLAATVEHAADEEEEEPETPVDPLSLIERCSLCRKEKSQCRTFSITAFCVGPKMIVQPHGPLSLGFPAMLCDDCNEAATARLSKETRETWDRFYDEYVDTPPRIHLDGPLPMIGV